MSVLIEGMEMPKGGYIDVRIFCDGTASFAIAKNPYFKEVEAVPIPEPHGRLIDADALHKLFEDQWHYLQVLDWNENPTAEAKQSGVNWCINTMHDSAPTIIPASEEG